MRVSPPLSFTFTLLLLAHGCGASRETAPRVVPRAATTLHLFDGRLTPREPRHRSYAELPDAASARPGLDLLRSRAAADSRWHDRVSTALLLMMNAAPEGDRPWLRRAMELVVWDRCAVDVERLQRGLPPLADACTAAQVAEIRKGGMPETLGPADLEDLEELRRVFAFAGGIGP